MEYCNGRYIYFVTAKVWYFYSNLIPVISISKQGSWSLDLFWGIRLKRIYATTQVAYKNVAPFKIIQFGLTYYLYFMPTQEGAHWLFVLQANQNGSSWFYNLFLGQPKWV